MCKLGSLHTDSNWRRNDAFVVDAKWIMEWYRKGKVGPQQVIAEIVLCKCAGAERACREVGFLEDKGVEIRGNHERYKVREELMRAFRAFKMFPLIKKWMSYYTSEFWGVLSRFLFLVLVGPSKLGKTNLALSLFGIHYTYVSNSQGVAEPYLKGYSPRFHKAILFDECSPETVLRCKQVFQANSDGCSLGHSPTGQYVNFHWLYQVPLIITTNTWLSEEELQLEENKWLVNNSVVVHIEEEVWNKE